MREGQWMTPHERMSHDIAMGWEWMEEMERRKEKKQQEWNARRRALWFWDLPFFDRVPAAYDPGSIGVMG